MLGWFATCDEHGELATDVACANDRNLLTRCHVILSELVGYFDAFHSGESDIQGRAQLASGGRGAATLLQVFCASIRFVGAMSSTRARAECFEVEIGKAGAKPVETFCDAWVRSAQRFAKEEHFPILVAAHPKHLRDVLTE